MVEKWTGSCRVVCSRFAVQDRRLQERTSLFYLQLDRIVGLLEALRGEAEYLGLEHGD